MKELISTAISLATLDDVIAYYTLWIYIIIYIHIIYIHIYIYLYERLNAVLSLTVHEWKSYIYFHNIYLDINNEKYS